MDEKDIIKIKSKKHSEYSSKIQQDDKTYYIVTELIEQTPPIVKSTVYLDGAHVETDRITLRAEDTDDPDRVVTEHHKSVVEKVRKRGLTSKKKVKYFRDIKRLIKQGEKEKALELTEKALQDFPDDPYGLSYKGVLLAELGDDPEEGVALCKEAIGGLEKTVPFGSDFFYPFFYLNLGRAYLHAGKKKEAVESLRTGLLYDNDNREIISELRKLGIRRRPILPFLPRSHPINKYLGLLLSRISSRGEG
ncbi:MAG: hypothetical protein D6726_12385 [Nitrospirae bacterium]|nr:MAG: hypothetical protein D6726_12385 [Nitrospirota bacterium]